VEKRIISLIVRDEGTGIREQGAGEIYLAWGERVCAEKAKERNGRARRVRVEKERAGITVDERK